MLNTNTELINFLKKLVNLKSASGKEKDIINFLEREIRKYTDRVRRIPLSKGRENLLASIGSGKKILCFNTHCDTMKPAGNSLPFSKEKDGRIYGLGACDAKSSLTSMFFAWKKYAEKKIPLRLDFLVSVDEELGGNGVLEVVRKGYKPDFAVVGEPTGLKIIIAHAGILWFSLKVKGKPAHGSSPWKGVSAIQKALDLLNSLKEEISKRPSHPLFGMPSLNLGLIKGGDSLNRVPEECEMWVDLRIAPGENLVEIENIIRKKVKKSGATFKLIRRGCPFLLKPAKPILVRKLSDCIRKIAKRKPEIIGWRGWTECDPFFNLGGAQTVVFGPGKIEAAHSSNEWVGINEVVLAKEVLSGLVEELVEEMGKMV